MYRFFFKSDIKIIGKPRMTKSDVWKKRKCVERYWGIHDILKYGLIEAIQDQVWYKILYDDKLKIKILDKYVLVLNWLAMFDKKKYSFWDKKPDKDNIEKVILDLFSNDQKIVMGKSAKMCWNLGGCIFIEGLVYNKNEFNDVYFMDLIENFFKH